MKITFPDNLPINQRRDEIAQLIKHNQVVIVAGETGSGKTTQLPKICLELGLAEHGLIAHTQPRRIAARTVADRIASELKVALGEEVGYQVRFNDQSSDKTQLKLMTDGVLLAEMQHDRLLKKYQTIIIDEAHERSLNIDFLLGLLRPICQKRPDLKVIITSATIDLEKFANHFLISGKPAPVIEVSGRTYPVETLYQAIESESANLADVISNTVEGIIRAEAKGKFKASGDILVFCAGEREIREAAQAIRRDQRSVEVLPLYSRLSVQEQNKVFKPAQRRKVVLATNVAETSITVPGIVYVIDPGLARISRYSFRSKIQRLPIEKISQASANQRQGRCGRVANGVCIRLYSQEDFELRPEFTQAEILRSNLASVILKMMRLGIHNIERFDFIDRPDNRLLNDGNKLLQELQAIENTSQGRNKKTKAHLTQIGRQMSDLPIDPRFARILVAANELDCLHDALILVSVLSIQDPRERPRDHQQAADQKHKELQHTQSDFFTYLHLWQKITDERQALSNSQFKQLCQSQFWSIARIFEWRELVGQLSQMCKSLGWKRTPWQSPTLPKVGDSKNKKKTAENKKGFDTRYAKLHQALLAGLLSNIATKDVGGEYIATRNRRIHLFPSSSQSKRKPSWLVAGEYLETSRVFAINVAQINPEWIIDAALHAVKYSHSAPHYHVRSGSIKALRKTLLQGLTLKDKELVNYSAINASESREVFIQEALVAQRYQPRGKKAEFVAHNQKLITDIEKIEAKTRKRNLLVNDQQIFAFFDERLPEYIMSRASLEKWLAKEHDGKAVNQDVLKLQREQLLVSELNTSEVAQFPNHIDVQGKPVAIRYRFDPGQAGDGVTMVVPIAVLAPFPLHLGDWLVPGLLREKCIALIKTLPKPIRRNYSPASDAVDRVFNKLLEKANSNTSLTAELADILYRTKGAKVTKDDFSPDKIDAYYRMNYRVIDTDGSLIEESRDLVALQQSYADAVQAAVHSNNAHEKTKLEKHNIETWDFGDLATSVNYQHQGMTVLAFPMLQVQADKHISLLIHDNEEQAAYHTRFGIIELAKQTLRQGSQRQAYKYLKKELMSAKSNSHPDNQNKNKSKTKAGLTQLASQLKNAAPKIRNSKISNSRISNCEDWVEELINAALNSACFDNNAESIRSQIDFENGLKKATQWVATAMDLEGALRSALQARDKIQTRLNKHPAKDVQTDQVHEEIKAQLYELFHPTFLRYTTASQLQQYPRYLKAIECRLDKVGHHANAQDEAYLAAQQIEFDDYCRSLTPDGFSADYPLVTNAHLRHFRIMLEEWRVSIYAQHLRTQMPVSHKRLKNYWVEHIKTAN